MHAGADRGDAGGPKGTARLPGRGTRERAELAGAAGRPQGARPGDRARAGSRRRSARLLEGAGGGLAHNPASALHRAQDANVLDKLPKSVQPAAKADLREVWTAPDRTAAAAAI